MSSAPGSGNVTDAESLPFWSPAPGSPSEFERLIDAVGLIANHPDCPVKQEVIVKCTEEIEGLSRSGRITTTQGERLLEILLSN
jgi:hypothetical protein